MKKPVVKSNFEGVVGVLFICIMVVMASGAVYWVANQNLPSLEIFGKLGFDEGSNQSKTKEFRIVAYMWEYYPNTITVNQGDEVHLIITALDTYHGFELPAWNISKTLVPEEPVEVSFVADKIGEFTFSCNYYCGEGHESMKGSIIVRK